MEKLKAVLISNNANNEVYLPNGSSIALDEEILKEFLNDPDFKDWNGENNFETSLNEVFEENRDDVVAYYLDDDLIINEEKFLKLKELMDIN